MEVHHVYTISTASLNTLLPTFCIPPPHTPLFLMQISVSNCLFSYKNKSMNNWWNGELQRSEASLSLLIKLSAWRPIGVTKAWNCLTFFFLLTHSAISYFPSNISHQEEAGASESFWRNPRICQAVCWCAGPWTCRRYGCDTVEKCSVKPLLDIVQSKGRSLDTFWNHRHTIEG